MEKRRVRVLLVDDQEELVEHLSRRLVSRGLTVVGVHDGEVAIELASQREFDVAVVDLHMPSLDGISTLKALKAAQPSLQVIMLTGYGSPESAFESGQHDAFRFLNKPHPFQELYAAILDAAERRRHFAGGEGSADSTAS